MAFAQRCTDEFGVATIAALHVPWRASSANPVHLHLMMMGPRRLTALGLTTYEHGLCFRRGQKLLATAGRRIAADAPDRCPAPTDTCPTDRKSQGEAAREDESGSPTRRMAAILQLRKIL